MTKRKYRHRRSVDVRITWLQPHVDGFKRWLGQRSYSAATIVEVVRLLALWGDWVRAAGFGVETLTVGLNASASVFKGSKTARAPQGAAALFVAYLRECNILLQEQAPSLEETWPALAAFSRWMREQRGIKDSTLNLYQPVLADLLISLGSDPAAYTAAAIRNFVLVRARPHGRSRARCIAVAKRMYLKYLVATGNALRGGSMRFRALRAGSWRRRRAFLVKVISTASLPTVRASAAYATALSCCFWLGWASGRAKSPISLLVTSIGRMAG